MSSMTPCMPKLKMITPLDWQLGNVIVSNITFYDFCSFWSVVMTVHTNIIITLTTYTEHWLDLWQAGLQTDRRTAIAYMLAQQSKPLKWKLRTCSLVSAVHPQVQQHSCRHGDNRLAVVHCRCTAPSRWLLTTHHSQVTDYTSSLTTMTTHVKTQYANK